MGTRGNSGIILSQILSGFAEGIDGRQRLFAEDIAHAFSRGVKKAYHAVLRPTEGTILTVVRETAEAAEGAAKTEKDLACILSIMVTSARASVERTPALLPKLAEAGVVDSGGLGFLCFIEGMLRLLQGEIDAGHLFGDEAPISSNMSGVTEGNWTFRYCTEFVLKGSQISEDAIKAALADMGESIMVVGDTRLARVHIHTGRPEEVLRYASTVGKVSSIKVDDMLTQHTSRFDNRDFPKTTSVVAVVLGDGF
jgi:dihydroxyacetone kinase-like predicted kinase